MAASFTLVHLAQQRGEQGLSKDDRDLILFA